MYIVLWQDKHVDAEVYGFETEDEAYMFAKDRCEDVYEENGFTVDYIMNDCMETNGWLFFASVEDIMTMRVEMLQHG